MMSKRFAKSLLLAASAMALCAGGASAANFDLTLTGVVSQGSFSNQTIGATHYDQWFLSLSGLSALNAFDIHEGDTINATINLDQAFTIPASQQLTTFGFYLFGGAFPQINTGTSNITTSFFLDGNPGLVGTGSSSTSSQVAASVAFFPPDNGPITFNSVTSSFTINVLPQTATVDGSGILYTLFSAAAVPEPSSWALMLIGFGGLGAALRARRRSSLAAA